MSRLVRGSTFPPERTHAPRGPYRASADVKCPVDSWCPPVLGRFSAQTLSPGFPRLADFRPRGGVHLADQLVQPSDRLIPVLLVNPRALYEPVVPGWAIPPVSFRDTAAGSPSAAHCPRSLSGVQDHVGCHARRSMRPRIRRQSVEVN